MIANLSQDPSYPTYTMKDYKTGRVLSICTIHEPTLNRYSRVEQSEEEERREKKEERRRGRGGGGEKLVAYYWVGWRRRREGEKLPVSESSTEAAMVRGSYRQSFCSLQVASIIAHCCFCLLLLLLAFITMSVSSGSIQYIPVHADLSLDWNTSLDRYFKPCIQQQD